MSGQNQVKKPGQQTLDELRKNLLQNKEQLKQLVFDAERFTGFIKLAPEIQRWKAEAEDLLLKSPGNQKAQDRKENANKLLLFYEEYHRLMSIMSLSQAMVRNLRDNLYVDGQLCDLDDISAADFYDVIKEDFTILSQIFK